MSSKKEKKENEYLKLPINSPKLSATRNFNVNTIWVCIFSRNWEHQFDTFYNLNQSMITANGVVFSSYICNLLIVICYATAKNICSKRSKLEKDCPGRELNSGLPHSVAVFLCDRRGHTSRVAWGGDRIIKVRVIIIIIIISLN